MHFWDSENALFEKFEGQKTAFRSENTSVKGVMPKRKLGFKPTIAAPIMVFYVSGVSGLLLLC
jgi:hypothetical protein